MFGVFKNLFADPRASSSLSKTFSVSSIAWTIFHTYIDLHYICVIYILTQPLRQSIFFYKLNRSAEEQQFIEDTFGSGTWDQIWLSAKVEDGPWMWLGE